VDTKIAATNTDSARIVHAALTEDLLSKELVRQGLPSCTIQAVTIMNSGQGNDTSAWLIICTTLGALIMLGVFSAWLASVLFHKVASEEEKELASSVSELRVRLKITEKDGYALSSDSTRLWRQRKDLIVIQKHHLEAAARLILLQDFDVNQFDCLCLCLDCQAPGAEADHSKPAYNAVCDLVLDVSKTLIKPDIQQRAGDGTEHAKGGLLGNISRLKIEERFPFFLRKVCRVRVWTDNAGALFLRLQAAAQEYMDDMAKLCDERFLELCSEPQGAQLLAFHANSSTGLVDVRRQDDPEVCSRPISTSCLPFDSSELSGFKLPFNDIWLFGQSIERFKSLHKDANSRFDLVSNGLDLKQ
jgi:hypothetical protein